MYIYIYMYAYIFLNYIHLCDATHWWWFMHGIVTLHANRAVPYPLFRFSFGMPFLLVLQARTSSRGKEGLLASMRWCPTTEVRARKQ